MYKKMLYIKYRAHKQGLTNPLVCLSVVSEKARPIGDKIFDLFVNVLFHRCLNSELNWCGCEDIC